MKNTHVLENTTIRKFEKQFTISSLLKKKFIWPDETNQNHTVDLTEQSAILQIWLIRLFRNLTGDSTSIDKSSLEDPIADKICGKIFPVNSFVFRPSIAVIFFLSNPFVLTWFKYYYPDLKMLFMTEHSFYLSKWQKFYLVVKFISLLKIK